MKFMFHESRNECFKFLVVSITQDSFDWWDVSNYLNILIGKYEIACDIYTHAW